VTSARRRCFASKSKIPPQLGGTALDVGKTSGDGVDFLCFHNVPWVAPVEWQRCCPFEPAQSFRRGASENDGNYTGNTTFSAVLMWLRSRFPEGGSGPGDFLFFGKKGRASHEGMARLRGETYDLDLAR
jgi:hypothetical protein